jgi:tetratricopeptide (TPR) repeat protein
MRVPARSISLAGWLAGGLVVVALGAGGCATAGAGTSRSVPGGAAQANGWGLYLDGKNAAAEAAFAREVFSHRAARAHLGLAIMAHESGDWERAFAEWSALLATADRDPLWPAMAEVAAHKLETLAAELPAAQARAARLAAIDLRPLPVEARQRVLATLAAFARRAGDEAGGRRYDRDAGCPDRWWTSATFGALPRLDLDTAYPPERSMGLNELHEAPTRGCRVTLDGSTGRAGVLYAVGLFRVDRRGEVVLTLDTDAPYRISLDSGEFRQIELDRFPARRRELRATVEPGWHRVLLKIGAQVGKVELELAAFADQPVAWFDGPPKDAPQARADRAALVPHVTAIPTPADREGRIIAELLRVHAAFRAGDEDTGEAPLDRLLKEVPRFAPAYLAAAQLWSEDPTRPFRFARDRARRALERALALDPSLLRARYNLSNIALEADHPREALDRLSEGPAPRIPSWRMAFARHQAYRSRGWEREAEEALATALKLNPEACPALEAEVTERRARHDLAGALRIAAQAATCRGGSDVYAETLRTSGDTAAAIREYRRLLRLEPHREIFASSLADTLLEAGDETGAVEVLTGLTRRAPRTVAYRLKLIDLLAARGDEKGARRMIEEGLGEVPESQELQRAESALCARGAGSRTRCEEILDPFRLDGKEVIAAFDNGGRRRAYDAPAVLVLDRTVTRVFPTGARLTLTHNIIQVLAKNGIDKWGEVKIPDGADVLVLRTVKADGTTREPEEILGKDTVSVPDLEVGDFVEFEYVDPSPPAAAFPGGFIAERFYFGSYDAPLDRSEYLVVTPAGMKVEVDSRGAAPPAVLSHQAGLDVRTFAAQKMPQLFAEPASTPFVEYVPSVRLGSGVSFHTWQRFLADQERFAQRSNEALRTVAEEVTKGAATPEAKLFALDDWVRRHVRHGGPLDEPATAILERGEGNRVTLLAALARAVGLPSEVWLARPTRAAQLEGALPELEAYDQPVLHVAGVGPGLTIDPRFRHSATGFVAPGLRGARGLRLVASEKAEFALVPASSSDERRMDITAALDRDGGAEIRVRETLTGWPALEWREGLERLAADRLGPEFEQHTLGFYFPGATLRSLEYHGKDEDRGPFTVEYRLFAPGYAQRIGGRLIFSAPYPALLQRRYAGVADRRTPLQVDYVARTTARVRVTVPKGASVQAPRSLHLAEVGEFQQAVTPTSDGFELQSRFALPEKRVAPNGYRAFVNFAAQVDGAEARAVEITRP